MPGKINSKKMASGGDGVRGASEVTNSSSAGANSDNLSIEDLQKEIETLKKRIIEEREKLRDKSVVQVAEGIEAVHSLNVKVRRSLKGHNAKVLCLDWSIDKRHLVSSSQVRLYFKQGNGFVSRFYKY